MEGVIAAVGSGALVGFTLGLIGGGGSILATPLLLYAVGISQAHVAIGTSALAVSANAYVNLISHARKGHVWWPSAILFAIVGAVGALAGSTLGKSFNGQLLILLFGVLMLAVGSLMLRPRKDAAVPRQVGNGRLFDLPTMIVALIVGLASGFFGIGGGFLIVPGLVLATGMPMINAVGSSLLAVGTFGLTTAINYGWSGLIDWVVAVEFICGGAIGGVLGTLAAARMAAHKNALNRLFAGVIFAVALYLIYRNASEFLVPANGSLGQ